MRILGSGTKTFNNFTTLIFTTVFLIGLGGAEAAPAARTKVKKTSLEFSTGKKIMVDVMDTEAGRERGLMFRRKLPKNYGMLFVFPQENPLQFWMKNTWASLDILFIRKDKSIAVVHERVRASTEKTTDDEVARVNGTGQYVLELPAGAARTYGLKAGQIVKFDAAIPRE